MSKHDNEVRLNPNNDKRAGKQDADFRGNANTICQHCGKENLWWADLWVNLTKEGHEWLRCLLKPREPLASAVDGESAHTSLKHHGQTATPEGHKAQTNNDNPVPF